MADSLCSEYRFGGVGGDGDRLDFIIDNIIHYRNSVPGTLFDLIG